MSAAITTHSTPSGVPCAFNIMSELWDRAAPSLDQKALEWFAGATGQAEYVASNLQDVVEGVGCLVAYDKEAGSFQEGDDFMSLMVTIANALTNIRGLMFVGDSASHRLRRPELYRDCERQEERVIDAELVKAIGARMRKARGLSANNHAQ